MSVFRLTDVSNRDREPKAYWDARTEREWGYPLHGLFGAAADIESRIAAMDRRNWAVMASFGRTSAMRVLECACGFGRYATGFSSLNYVGIDLADKNITEARKVYAAYDFQVADMATYTTSRKFDLIFMVAAWSSIEQKSAEVIAHLRNLLVPGGRIAIFEETLYMVIDK